MAENQENSSESASGRTFGESEAPSEQELFTGDQPSAGPADSEQQVFVGDEDFYKFLAEPYQETEKQRNRETNVLCRFIPLPLCKKVLVPCAVLIITMMLSGLLYLLLKPHSVPIKEFKTQSRPVGTKLGTQNSKLLSEANKLKIQNSKFKITEQPLSLKIAQEFELKGDYNNAYAAYNQLCQNIQAKMTSNVTEDELMKDFLRLKMALCMEKGAVLEQANSVLSGLRTVSQSRSPVIRAIANYHLSLLKMQNKQYLSARARAYQAISLIDAVDFEPVQRLSELKRDCYFLAAEALTRNVLLLCDADKNLPESLWTEPKAQKAPFINLNETQLRTLLHSGSEQLNKALLGPQIQQVKRSGSIGTARYTVICRRAPIEELLARFAANAMLDINWAFGLTPIGIHKRPVNLYMLEATTQQVVTAAAGSVGLLARQDKEGSVTIYNPEDYSSLPEHKRLLSDEAISLWQKFLLAFHSDERIANAHFAIGLLYAQKGNIGESIAEYKLVANRFSKTSLAPFALLHAAKLKAGLRDYSGARQDLKQLAEQYSYTKVAESTHLYLADITAKAGLIAEAARLYRKTYNLGLSSESQSTAALRAGECFYQLKDYESAAKWLIRYITLAKDRKNETACSAYFLLGKTNMALGKSQQACDAFQYALTGHLPREKYVEAVSALVEGYMEQENFVQALGVLEDIDLAAFSEKEAVEILLLKSGILRAIGLTDEAIALLGDRVEYTSDQQLKAKISLELTDCWVAEGNLELARRKLTEIIATAEPGPLTHEITLKLANVCLKLGRNSQSISICSQLLDSAPSAMIRQKALNIIAAAYKQQKNYDKAALALLGQWK